MKGLALNRAQSVRLTVLAFTLTNTSLGFGIGLSNSTILRTTGGPYW